MALLWLLIAGAANAVRIKDICTIEGVRENQLIGYGLVVGLSGTGDDTGTGFTIRSLSAFMRKHNINVDPRNIDVDNVAAVMVTATLPPFARQGMNIDVKVSSLGDAENLQGGMLIATPLRPVSASPNDANSIYAVAQGTV
ncbi:MAG: flagellar basal body P-ring protein FlgI, partial [Candidatus Sumerlaeota bacterium]